METACSQRLLWRAHSPEEAFRAKHPVHTRQAGTRARLTRQADYLGAGKIRYPGGSLTERYFDINRPRPGSRRQITKSASIMGNWLALFDFHGTGPQETGCGRS